ncbi:MAG: phosphoribosylamine--glycine ligase [Candidatus Melainabacteria bacterium GWF2_37_15]|nr:MAG: phosphoribosylamine--glycine ligase [Candidatus Melainabacteria bacterium GWF2_37_15]
MKVFVISSGGKAHSLVWKLVQSQRVSEVFCTFNNAIMPKLATVVDIRENNSEELYKFIKENKIDLTIIDSTTTGVTGLANKLRQEGINVFGPDKDSCKLQLQKGFTKKFLYKHKIPTPTFAVYDKESQALAYARTAQYPLVVKFDSRVPGLGSIVCESFNEAKNVISFCLKNFYKPVVLENFISGKFISFQVITDGYDAVPLPVSCVCKKAEDGNAGPNTQGMGAYSPVSFVNRELESEMAQKIFFPLIDALNAEKLTFAGALKANIVIDEKNNPYLIGIDVGFADPETQTVLPLIKEDLFEVLMAASIGALGDTYELLNTGDEHSVCVNLVSEGYPGEYKKGFVIEGLEEIDDDNTIIFHAYTGKNVYAETVTSGGVVLSVVSTASTLNRAQELVYESVDLIKFDGMKYRKDIAKLKVPTL